MHIFALEIEWHQYQVVISTFHQVIKEHYLEDSSRLKEKCQSQIPMRPSGNHFYSHSQYSSKAILEVPPQGIFKRQSQTNLPRVSTPSSHLGNHIHSIQSGFIKTCILIINHGSSIQHSSFLNLARYTLHQAVNTASRIQYRPAVSLKESSSQLFTYTSLL
ncbi:hypothetical protein O181_019285 [Austropuccinia psidii MF-1]|uniref:Uncharacterized protein n=1 Tax=Austropuccinia psidii MF-1 TaxID=1389203 RepID=A0A9Q3CAB1_9BASI|nr:hypothetical protein [Austropuccinia psidii MF-1]